MYKISINFEWSLIEFGFKSNLSKCSNVFHSKFSSGSTSLFYARSHLPFLPARPSTRSSPQGRAYLDGRHCSLPALAPDRVMEGTDAQKDTHRHFSLPRPQTCPPTAPTRNPGRHRTHPNHPRAPPSGRKPQKI